MLAIEHAHRISAGGLERRIGRSPDHVSGVTSDRRSADQRMSQTLDRDDVPGVRGADVLPEVFSTDELLGSMPDALFALDAGWRFTYVNAHAERLVERPAAELVGRSLWDLFPRADGSVFGSHYRRAVAGGASVSFTAFYPPLDRWLSVHASPLAGGLLVHVRDDVDHGQCATRLRQETEALHWGDRIRGALREDRLLLYRQPIVTAADGATAGHELLIRLRNPDGTLVSPAAFLPAAERHGLMGQIDRWVILRAAELARRGERVHVNISPCSIDEQPVLDALADAAGGDTAARVTIEITETALGEDADAVARFAGHVHALGYRVALDDFGTGYNTFSRVKQLALHELKIDVQFVRDLGHSAASAGVVQAIISLAQALGADTVAEGVEDAETAARLRELGVTHLQGYHFGRPAPVDP
jgi:EAL domain-containing protein (putative c-di-GMP-specific phosphodiesterase class I)